MGLLAANRADIAWPPAQRRGNRRIVELRIMGEDDDIGRTIHRQILQHLVWPGMDDAARLGKSLAIGKFRARIDDGDTETEPVGEPGQRDGDMGSAEDEELRRSREGL